MGAYGMPGWFHAPRYMLNWPAGPLRGDQDGGPHRIAQHPLAVAGIGHDEEGADACRLSAAA